MGLESFIEKLEFNSYEKSAVLFLSGMQQASASAIGKGAKIPQGRIYSVLNSLISRGIVQVVPSRPKQYQIENVKEALKRHMHQQQSKIKERLIELKNIEEPAKSFSLHKKSSTVVFSGRDEHVDAITMLRDSAQKEIVQIAPLFIGSFASRRSIQKASQKGIKLRIITLGVTPKNKKTIKAALDAGAGVRISKEKDLLSLTIKDKKEFLLGIDAYHKKEERMTIYSKNKAVLDTLYESFEKLWKKSTPVKKV